jgi:hypothetical protein
VDKVLSRLDQDDVLYAKLDAKHMALKHAAEPFPPERKVIRAWAIMNGYLPMLAEFLYEYDEHFARNRKIPSIRF